MEIARNAGAGETLDRIIPEIYNEAMFPGTAMLYSFPSYVYSLWQEYSVEELEYIASFCKERKFRQQQYTGSIGQKKRRRSLKKTGSVCMFIRLMTVTRPEDTFRREQKESVPIS